MKVLAVLLVCALVAVQARSNVNKHSVTLATRGENPWLLHLRVAVSTSGLLNSCAGSLISQNWALTSGGCVQDVRFIWVRYGAVNVINPELVTETSTVRLNTAVDLALVSINRMVQTTTGVSPVSLGAIDSSVTDYTFCGYGAGEDSAPGEVLQCYGVSVAENDGALIACSADSDITKYDIGAPLVSEGVQVAVLVSPSDDSSAATFLAIDDYVSWIEEETGQSFSRVGARV